MNSKSRLRYFFPILAVFAVNTMSAREFDPVSVMNKTRYEHRQKQAQSGPNAADELFAIPEWREEMAKKIKSLVVAARDNPELVAKKAKLIEQLPPQHIREELGPEATVKILEINQAPILTSNGQAARSQ